ncbi:MAG: carboxypeptidase M32 [Myxococcales bacterium]|nr:carboxypeptidase M32 [Myxococcales bacterium]MCB9520691.1 carboxypeptidase M32 [Myxococcales bacterium]
MTSAYQQLTSTFDRISQVQSAAAMLGWDMQTMMPPGGAESRGAQLATLGVIAHELLVAPQVGDLLDAAEQDMSLGAWEAANVREMRRSYVHATAVEPRLVDALARAGAACFGVWKQARADNDFEAFLPSLTTVFDLTREASVAKGEALGISAFDAAIDTFEPGGRAAEIASVFAVLEREIPPILSAVEARQDAAGPPLPLVGPFDTERQRSLGVRVMQAIGFDFNHGRLDVSVHPFCGGSPDDVRITTRYDEADFTSSLMGVIHETGHAMYERGLPAAWRGQPVGVARGMALHESQSLLIEMQAARSDEFIRYIAPLVAEELGRSGPAYDATNLRAHYRRVERGFIRVDADEVTYPLHVILRFRIERALFSGDLELADLPDAWGQGMQSLLGITPPTDRQGCLQDMHWTDGAFGYFPSYTLGAIAAAQLFAAANEANSDIRPAIARGDFSPLLAWLRTNVHERGASATSAEILTAATGRSFDAEAFVAHLRSRYLG